MYVKNVTLLCLFAQKPRVVLGKHLRNVTRTKLKATTQVSLCPGTP